MEITAIKHYACSDKGAFREKNEDAYFADVKEIDGVWCGIFAVADGVGGLDAGDMASKIAIESVEMIWAIRQRNSEDSRVLLDFCFQKADESIRNYGRENNIRLATTLSILFIDGGVASIFHIGDSKIYKVSPSKNKNICKKMTLDHTVRKKGSDQWLLSECLGNVRKTYNPFITQFGVCETDRFYLGTDGAFNTWTVNYMQRVGRIDQNAYLVDMLRKQAVRDNITMVSLGFEGRKHDEEKDFGQPNGLQKLLK